MAQTLAKNLITIAVVRKPEVVGRALMIHTEFKPNPDAPKVHYIPFSCISSYTDKEVTMDKWIADKKGLLP